MVCCLFGEVEMAKALDPVDMSGKCIRINMPAGVGKTLDDVCMARGYGKCSTATGVLSAFTDSNCTAGIAGPAVNCGTVITPPIDWKSVRLANLKCNPKIWGTLPQPDNVPGDFEQSIKNTTDWILGFVGMIAVLMLIWGGVNYLTSAGDEDKARIGKKTISYAIIGLVVAGIAYAIVNVIITVIL